MADLGTALHEGIYTLHDLCDFHDYMDEEEENARRARAASRSKDRDVFDS